MGHQLAAAGIQLRPSAAAHPLVRATARPAPRDSGPGSSAARSCGMRGGAIPLLAWGTLLLVLFIGNWIWNAKPVNAAAAAFAALVIYLTAALVTIFSGRRALRRGPPEPRADPEAVPQASTGAVIVALGFASLLFGLTFGNFAIYFGAALLVLGVGRLAVELRSERASRA